MQCRPGDSQDPLPQVRIAAERWGNDPVHHHMRWLWVLAFARTTGWRGHAKSLPVILTHERIVNDLRYVPRRAITA